MQITFSLEQINAVAEQILAQKLKNVILFYGEMGAGKTTLIKNLAKSLGVKSPTNSPTFSLVNEYQTAENKLLYHFDMYRIKSENEAYDIGMEEYLYSGNWCFIEWPEKIPNLIPEEHSIIKIKLIDNGKRELILTS
ncbi:tRNA (adenosine(37)-N6)-threonylcarbamoyltransferase complex ATPase subunit type 1 TsaE [Flavobacterium psychrotolerans]|uniref:tRNA threonylcarbamoyladenosine biosynthesis protein TsaE n=1 Tax=Flavobacterium psychrotolerans TaxID=2169410 RepID=A0A2U1JHV6_9FLAO|nr:tRNA (adenosine(37)-N6)-threonylcarbamoyltransferase complex ATPase subunit type 1 TsaE [Flavobacterium psychrotolerans]PWA04712.1 tRNA (adenosine(37)-N6)-threonylcarbamoyltransferase complex ATPase subunit type 1 TsaE [Flavobacterium psychrotolerans]